MPFQTYHRHGILLSLFLLSKLVTSQQSPPEQTPPPPPPPSYNFSPAMATAVIVLIIFFFSIGFISVYIRHFMHCLGIVVPGTNMRGGIEAWRRGGFSRGLDPTVIETFPTFLYSDVKIHRVDKSSLECAICLNEFMDHEILRMLPSCSHVFHPNCVDTWLTSHVTCPICRAILEINESDRSLSFNYLAHQDQPILSDNEELESYHNNQNVIVRLERSNEVSLVITSPTVSEIKGVGDRIGKLPRSHSTGHSLVDDCERYTLRLPDEVRNKLVNVNLSGLPAAIVSPRVGYRARSVGCTNIEGVKEDHRWRFSVSPPFIARSNSVQSQKSDSVTEVNNNNHSVEIMRGPINLLKSIKSPLNRVAKFDDIGERSTNRLWVNRTKQDVELEAQWNNNQ